MKAQIDQEASKAVYGDAKRMAELTTEAQRALRSNTTDAATVNGLLRRLFKSLKIDIEAREVFVEWQAELGFELVAALVRNGSRLPYQPYRPGDIIQS